MTLDETALAEVLAHRERYIDAQLAVDRAKAEYHAGIRRLHAGGGSLREIASALGVSHQLVHQIVGDEPPPPPTAVIRCTFCKRSQKEVKKLIAGPGVYICDVCVGLTHSLARGNADEVTAGDQSMEAVRDQSNARCSFCKKRSREVKVLINGGGVHICNECVDLCDDILAAEG